MKTALVRRLAPFSLLAIPFLVPIVASSGNAATSAPIPAAARGVAFGTSLGTSSAATVKMFPNARVGRVFQNSASAKLPSLPSSYQIWVSFNGSTSAVTSGKFNAEFAKILQSWNASGRTVYWNWQHEADRGGMSSAQFRAGWAQLLSVAKKYPSPRVHSMSILTGFVLYPNQPHGNPESWYVNADVLGFDTYLQPAIPRAMNYAKSKHKPWAIPEFGNRGGDTKNIAYIQQNMQAWAAYPPIGAAWFNNTAAARMSQPLSQIPKTLAYLRALAG
jgi:hypothetical protein